MSLRRRRLLRFHLVPFFFRLLLCKSHAPENQNGDTVTRHTTKWSWCWCLVYWYHHTSWHPDFWYSFAIPIIVSHVEYCLAIISSAFERGSFGLLRTRFRSSQNSNLILCSLLNIHYSLPKMICNSLQSQDLWLHRRCHALRFGLWKNLLHWSIEGKKIGIWQIR